METFSYSNAQPIGYLWLVNTYKLTVIPHYRWSYIIATGARRVLKNNSPTIHLYDQGYALENQDNPMEHLIFAIKHEGLNLEIIAALFDQISHDIINKCVTMQPTGKYQRIIWYLYEKVTNKKIDHEDLQTGPYIPLLDPEEYYTSSPIAHQRYRIHDNLLGTIHFCPFVRKTENLIQMERKNLDHIAKNMIAGHTQHHLERASTYLYAQETMSSYQIERERPHKQRLMRFILLVKKAEETPHLTESVFTAIQNALVEDRFANTTYRATQNYIGETRDWYQQIIHYISPKPEDVPTLMAHLLNTLERMLTSNTHPIIIASVLSFAFVFIHPFDDGNGRLHRFLMHYILHKTGFTPHGMIFPISAIILADMQEYTKTLECFSKPLMALITDYTLNDEGILTVNTPTLSLYRCIDYTSQTEYLASCIEKTIHTNFKKELDYLTHYDTTKKALRDIVDMPDALIDLFIKLTTHNNGHLSSNKRAIHFSMISDDEIKRMETVVQNIWFSNASQPETNHQEKI